MKAFFTEQPQPLVYARRGDGTADVWIRRGIHEQETAEGDIEWVADEAYIHTDLTSEEIEAAADAIFARETAEIAPADDRISACEDAIEEIASLIEELMAGG